MNSLTPVADEESIAMKIKAKKEELKQTDIPPKTRLRINKEIAVLREQEKHINDPTYKFKEREGKVCPTCGRKM